MSMTELPLMLLLIYVVLQSASNPTDIATCRHRLTGRPARAFLTSWKTHAGRRPRANERGSLTGWYQLRRSLFSWENANTAACRREE